MDKIAEEDAPPREGERTERRARRDTLAERAAARQRAIERRREERRAARRALETEAADPAEIAGEEDPALAAALVGPVAEAVPDAPQGRDLALRREPAGDLPAVAPEPAPAPAPATGPAGLEPLGPPRLPEEAARPRRRRRNWFAILSFLVMVVAPGGWLVHYLYARAADQFHSVVAFSVRSEEPMTALPELPFSIKGGSPGALDSDILYEFIRSQQLVETLDRELDLRAMYNRRPDDWLFAFGENRPIEDLVAHWGWMVDVDYDTATSLIQVQAYAFTAEDARRVTEAVLRESTALINSLSQQAREDAIRFAQRELEEASARLRDIRLKLREFRDRTQTADPTQDVQVQMGVILELQKALAEALISRAELLSFARPTDPRVAEAERRIRAIEDQIAAEKTRLGTGGAEGGGNVLAGLIGTFEELKTDLGFAEQAYVAAQSALDKARIEARRQTRYLAAHVAPTLSEAPQYPRRLVLSLLGVGALFAAWALLVLVVANLGDRR